MSIATPTAARRKTAPSSAVRWLRALAHLSRDRETAMAFRAATEARLDKLEARVSAQEAAVAPWVGLDPDVVENIAISAPVALRELRRDVDALRGEFAAFR